MKDMFRLMGKLAVLFLFTFVVVGAEVYLLTHFEPEITLPINGAIVVLWVVSGMRGRLISNDAN